MKNIELTEEHKSKLLEMCKVLFPEYTKIDLEIEDNYDGIKDYIMFEKTIPLKSNTIIYIHWFEFCMTHLANKILIQDEQLNDFLLTFNVELHLVDYLYEKFKKY